MEVPPWIQTGGLPHHNVHPWHATRASLPGQQFRAHSEAKYSMWSWSMYRASDSLDDKNSQVHP